MTWNSYALSAWGSRPRLCEARRGTARLASLARQGMRIGEVAKGARVSVAAVRYYERLGLLEEAPRTLAGYREFTPDAVRRLAFIQRAQGIGFSLPEIRQLLDLRHEATAPAAEVRAQVEAKLDGVEAKMRELERLKVALQNLRDACCRGSSTADECPILDALEGSR